MSQGINNRFAPDNALDPLLDNRQSAVRVAQRRAAQKRFRYLCVATGPQGARRAMSRSQRDVEAHSPKLWRSLDMRQRYELTVFLATLDTWRALA